MAYSYHDLQTGIKAHTPTQGYVIGLQQNTLVPNITLRKIGTAYDTLQNATDDLSKVLDNPLHTQRIGVATTIGIGATINTTTIPTIATSGNFIAVDETNGDIQTGAYGDTLTLTNTATVTYILATPTITELTQLDEIFGFKDGALYQEGTLLNQIDYSIAQNKSAVLQTLVDDSENKDEKIAEIFRILSANALTE